MGWPVRLDALFRMLLLDAKVNVTAHQPNPMSATATQIPMAKLCNLSFSVHFSIPLTTS